MLAERERLGFLVALPGHDLHLRHTLGQAQGGLHRVGESPFDAGAAHEPVDDHLDRVVLVARQLHLL